MPDASLIRDFGPIVIFLWFLPGMVDRVARMIDTGQQMRAEAARAPYEAINTVLSTNAKSDLIAIEIIGLRAAVDRANEALKEIKDELKMFIESQRSKE